MRLRSPALLCSLALLSAFAASAAERKPRIAVFSGPTATIQNSRPLVTSNKARAAAGLPPLTGADGKPLTDELFMQRIAAPVTVYVEQFTAHPLEGEVAALYAAPDGFVAADGSFSPTRRSPADKPVYAVTLRPEDGLYPLPFMGRQAAGSAWDGVGTTRGAPFEQSRQTFYPDGSRIFEEIERLGGRIHEKAEFTFFRPAPSGGFTSKGEKRGEDFYGYGPYNASPSRPALARATNIVAAAARDTAAAFDGFIWLEGSPSIEDTIYWLGLVIDTTKPFIGNSAQRARGLLSADGDANIVDSVNYITGRVWDDGSGRDRVGAVMIQDQQIFNAREVQKGDARPGGYVTTGGFGGLVGATDYVPRLTFLSVRKSTHRSDVRLSQIPASVETVTRGASGLTSVAFAVKDKDGALLPAAIPYVTIAKSARWQTDNDTARDAGGQVEILARLDTLLSGPPVLAGFVGEGFAPYGSQVAPVEAALDRAVLSGFPVVQSPRGNASGFMAPSDDNLRIESGNLTATKSRILLMACLLRFGALPPAKDPLKPTSAELSAIKAKLRLYQAVFDTH